MMRAELEERMTETTEVEIIDADETSDIDAVIETVERAIELIDGALAATAGHNIVAASEMSDLLLDVRLLLSPLVA
jgi:hypothetical protein